jgi:hypothetical protein
MVRIAITQAAFDAIAATLPLGSVGYENKTNERLARLKAIREPGESYSDVIIRMAGLKPSSAPATTSTTAGTARAMRGPNGGGRVRALG